MKKTKTSLFHSGLALLLCISMLIGSTFAWFSDSISSGKNIITAGNLDLEMYWTDDLDSGEWHNVEENGHNTIFNYDNWEPGYTDVKYIKLVNAGDLALNYKLSLTPQNGVGKLAEVINVYFAEGGVAVEQRSDLQSLRSIGLLDNVLNGGATADGTLLSADQYSPLHPSGEIVMTVAMNMLTTAGNEYQNEDAGEFSITALATQAPFETDSFGSDYDSNAKYPAVLNSDSASATVNPVNGKVPAGGVALTGGNISAFVPEGVVLENGTTKLTLTVTPLKNTTSDITVVNGEILIPVDVHIDGVADGNTVPIIVDLGEVLPKYLNMGNYHLYHVENGANSVMTLVADASALTAHNTFTYDPLTGEVSVAMASFSEVTMLADTAAKWDGKEDDSWYDVAKTELQIANADQLYSFAKIVGGMADGTTQDSFKNKTVKLLSDINLNHGTVVDDGIKRIFYPVGYYNTDNGVYTDKDKYDDKTNIAISSGFKTFEGTFDGNGHTISNVYQNTWEMKGDHDWYAAEDQHYRDGMGIFGRVYGGTIKNLTVDNFESDGEITTTGVVAAYADFGATFENIAITNCNPRVYNIGNGGIVGCVGWYTKGVTDKKVTFKNITVDNSNKISALWGSYDVPCGGIVGQYYPTSGQSSYNYPANPGIHFENCHAAAQMDVNNDVCGNYQYYAYRYAGMLIGSVRENETIDGHVYPKMDGITAEKCTVHFGTWNDYYYCEFEKNGHPSYSGPDDYKFSRVPHSELNFTDFDSNEKINTIEERNSVTGCKHVHTAAENNQAVYLPFNNLVTGYGWGVTTKVVGDMEGVTILDREEANSVEKFETKFTGDFLYRVGNQNTISVGSLFKYKGTILAKDQNGSGVVVSVEKVDESMTVGGTFTANTSDWTKGTIQFSGTGVVKVTIQDYNFCKPTVLYLEVVEAKNTTTATSAKTNNVVLLNDCGFSSLEVSGGYTLYGNGFTMTCSSDSYAKDRTYSFVELNGGTLDNVQIVVPNFSHAIMYEKNKSENNNDTDGDGRYKNIKSAIKVTATSTITNSYISGGRAAIYAIAGTLNIKNTTIYGGAVANIQTEKSCNLILEDVTLIQKPIKANVNDTSRTVMGLSVVTMCDSVGEGSKITLKGYLHQYAWGNSDYKQYVPSDAQSVVNQVLSNSDYIHSITYADGITRDSVNLGFVNMPLDLNQAGYQNISNETDLSYDWVKVQTAYIYTYKNTKGTIDAVKSEPTYTANAQGVVLSDINYSDTNENRVFTTTYNETEAMWKSTLKVDVDAGDYTFSFAKLIAQKYGNNLNYQITTKSGATVDKNSTITLNSAVSNVYILTITDNQIYDKNGNKTGETVVYQYMFELLSTKTSLPAPTWTSTTLNGTPYIVVDSKGGDWNCAVPVLDGLEVKYWSKKQNKEIELNLADAISAAGLSNGLQNGSNNTITINVADEYTLQITTTSFKTNDNGKPVVVNGKLYFTVSSSSNYVSTSTTSRTPNISYVFTDANNSDSITLSTSFNVVYATYKGTQYKYSSFCNGKLEEATTGCITEGTLITMADGTQKPVEEIKLGDLVLAFNHETGEFVPTPVIFNTHVNDLEAREYDVLHLEFSNGQKLEIVESHGLFDMTLMKYVYLDYDNYVDFIGHTFFYAGADGASSEDITLENAYVKKEITRIFCPVTYFNMNSIANGFLNAPNSPYGISGPVNYFDYDPDLRYNAEKMQADIEKYGLYTYDDFKDYMTEEAFNSSTAIYLKIAEAKGLITYEEIIIVINYLLEGSLIK